MTDLLTQSFIYLAAAVVSVTIARRIGLGSVLGYLLAGIIIGPYGFGWVGQDNEAVLHFAEFGVVMMLFIIGLELQPKLLWQMRRSIFLLGGLQMAVTTSLLTPLFASISAISWQQALGLGMSLSLSSTAIVLQTLNERHQLNTPPGQGSFSVLLFQDIAVIPLLSLLPLLATFPLSPESAASHQTSLIADLSPLWKTSAIIAVLVGIVVFGRYLTRPIFRLIASLHMREIFCAFALVIVIGISLAMSAIGLSAALGAFLAGVVLANSEYRHELEAVIEPFKGLLLAVFFIAVGSSMNFSVMAENIGLTALLVVLVVAVKWLVTFAVIYLQPLRSRSQRLSATLLAQGGEFGFVLLGFGVANGVFSKDISQLFMGVITLTMLATPLLLMLLDAFDRGGDGLESGSDKSLSNWTTHGRVIICGYGRFGQIVSRLLHINHVETVLLDHNPQQIQRVREFGIEVYYGDATNNDLLEKAGAARADLMIVAVDDPDQAVEIVTACRKHYPKLQILARAHDRGHAFELMHAKADKVFRETFSSALDMGVDALGRLGFRRHQAYRLGQKFSRHDHDSLKELAATWKMDKPAYIAQAREKAASIVEQLSGDHADPLLIEDHDWDSPAKEKPLEQ